MVYERPNYMVASLKKIATLTCVLAGVILVVYYTPMPEEYFLNCDRRCHELDWPMICRVKLTLEVYKTLSRACDNCPANSTECEHQHCITADGHHRGILTVNRLLPAPAIHVCLNDILVVDVVNRIPGQAVSIHWRGQPQKETPFMDGVPMVTQCPIPSYTTFQYKFRASAIGTHMYHAHSAAEMSDGIVGAFVVRQADSLEPLKKYYDEDKSDHIIVVSEWSHGFAIQNLLDIHPLAIEALLINGKGSSPMSKSDEDLTSIPISVFTVKSGLRYRFRVAYAGGVRGCPIAISVQTHSLKIIALDGHAIIPRDVELLELGRGERVDFVITADQEVSSYKIKVSTVESCAEVVSGEAILKYDGASDESYPVKNVDETSSSELYSSIGSEKCAEDRTYCVDEIRSLEKIPEELAKDKTDITFYIPYQYKKNEHVEKRIERVGSVDGVKFTFPPSPLLTQGADVPRGALCGAARRERHDQRREQRECVHVKRVPLDATVQLVLVNQDGDSDHVFHLHGYSFYVIATKEYNTTINMETLKEKDGENSLFESLNLVDPVRKDTITIPKYGVTALRFKADNPGYWMLRDERSNHWTRGLDLLFKVGDDGDFVQAPADFPKCGSYVGPEYFFI